MSVEVFGVTYTTVQQHCFPRLDVWSATTSPTSTTVTAKITVAGAKLAAALSKESIDPSDIASDTGSAAYAICADIVRKMTALDLRIPTDDPDAVKAWQKETDDFFALLEEDAGLALADSSLPSSSSNPNGPTTHISEYGLEVSDTDDMSTAVIALRKDDAL